MKERKGTFGNSEKFFLRTEDSAKYLNFQCLLPRAAKWGVYPNPFSFVKCRKTPDIVLPNVDLSASLYKMKESREDFKTFTFD